MLDVVGRDDVTLNCTATGNPPPVYSLSSDTMDKVEVQAVHIAPLLPGTYSCTASNEVGTSTKKFIVNETKSKIMLPALESITLESCSKL